MILIGVLSRNTCLEHAGGLVLKDASGTVAIMVTYVNYDESA